METHWAIFTAITLGAGVQWHEAYDAVDQIGRMIMVGLRRGARCRLLMVLVLLSLLCFLRAYTGSGVHNTIEIKVVTFCGEYLVTNKYQKL